MKEKFKIQDEQYSFPYHHLVGFKPFNNYSVMSWGIEYYIYIKRVIDIVKNREFLSLLDVGCGEGKLILELKNVLQKEKVLNGIDLSERAILFARAFNYGNGAKFECADISSLSNSYDVITLIETIEHVPDEYIVSFIKNIFNRLNTGGVLIVTVPSSNMSLQKKHYRHYDAVILSEQFKDFQLIESHYVVKDGFIYRILIRLFRKFCSFDIIKKLLFVLSSKFIFDADENTARHIVCVFKKT